MTRSLLSFARAKTLTLMCYLLSLIHKELFSVQCDLLAQFCEGDHLLLSGGISDAAGVANLHGA